MSEVGTSKSANEPSASGNGHEQAVPDQPMLDQRALRRCFGQFATGVTVVTAQAAGEAAGVTANSFASVSLDPPLILWSIGKTSRSMSVFQAATHFAVNILAADQINVSQAFSRSESSKFANIPWTEGAGGAPVIHGAVATIVCQPEAFHDAGDHIIMVGRVVEYQQRDAPVLLFSQGHYGVAGAHPEVKPPALDSAPEDAPRELSYPLLRLLYRAYDATSAGFDELRRQEHLTVAQSRLLASLSEGPSDNPKQLAARALLGQRDAEDAINDLIDMRDVDRDGDILSLTAEGSIRLERFQRTIADFERALLADFPADEVEIGRRFLARLGTKRLAEAS